MSIPEKQVLQTFENKGEPQKVTFVETMDVTEGVQCDVYSFVDDSEKDLAIIRIAAGKHTPSQRVIKGDKTIEGYISGKGKLIITKQTGEEDVYRTDEKHLEVVVNTGDVMQWIADSNSPLIAYEICYPPYEDGRYQNL